MQPNAARVHLDQLRDRIETVLHELSRYRAAGDLTLQPSSADPGAGERINSRLREHTDLPEQQLQRRFCLTPTEMAIIWLLAGLGVSPDVRRAVSEIGGQGTFDPSLEVLKLLTFGREPSLAGLNELSASGTLRTFRLIERSDGIGDVHESQTTWCLSKSVLRYLHGGDAAPSSDVVALSPRGSHVSALSELAIDPEVIAATKDAMRTYSSLVVVAGMRGLGRRSLLGAIALETGADMLTIDARRLSDDRSSLLNQLAAIALECKLLGRAPLIANIDALVDEKTERLALIGRELAPLIDGPILITCGVQRPKLDWGRPTIVIEMGQPTTEQRATLWHTALGQGTEADAQLLADHYPLAPALIVRAAEAAKARAGERPLEPEDIYAGIRAVLDDRLGQYARRVTVTQTWNDLVLPQDQVDAIVELTARVRERRTVYETWGFASKVGRGLGVSALFSGPPGTGKTMVAALIAKDLGLELYQVDMSKVVSKYIGETEKNLGAMFDAAEAGHAILLFDEADALFGKRTDVKSSNDRYANLETNYLLQRLESFTGICLLTSNHESHIDPAFQRRLSLHLRFELPEAEERAQLWRAILPTAAPVSAEVDFAALGRRYAMSGGYIRNAALRAAFLAANEGAAITAAHLERAARVEYEGMGKLTA